MLCLRSITLGNDDKPTGANSGVSKNARVSFSLPETQCGSFSNAELCLVHVLCVVCVSNNAKKMQCTHSMSVQYLNNCFFE